MSSEPAPPSDFSGVFCDTSVLLNYVLAEGNSEAKELLRNHHSDNYTGSTVEREFEELKKRRENILKSIYKCQDLSNWNPPSNVDMSTNDRGWCGELLNRLDEMASRSAVETRLNQEEKKLKRGMDHLFTLNNNLIDTVWPNKLDAMLLGRLEFIENGNDRQVVCESADWACNSAADNLLTSDWDDLLSQRERISEEVDRNRNLDTLHLYSPSEFLNHDSSP